MDEGKIILDKLMKPFPQSAIKKRTGAGNKSFDYIEGSTAIRRLIDATGGGYEMSYVTHWVYEEEYTVAKTGEIKTRYILNMMINVTIPHLGTYLGHGVAVLGGGEDLAKGALTDAYKNALKYAGVALDLYGEDYEIPARPLPIRKQLANLTRGMDVVTLAKERYNKEPKALTEDEVRDWIDELSTPKDTVAF